jgi:hypothetical protein
MRRQALLAAAVLAVAAAPAARAEPLDVDLSRLGAPLASTWGAVNPAGTPAQNAQLARDACQRFAILSTDLGLALSTAILHPASTTGYSGFAVDLEAATMAPHTDLVGVAPAGLSSSPWASRSQPTQLYMPSVHVRKGLPFSLEFGGRLVYLASSNAFAGQGEAKWAFVEGFDYFPDLAVRAAYTRLFGVKDWNLGTTDLDFMISKRFGLMGVTSLTPYAAARYTWIKSSSELIDFAQAPHAPTDLSTSAQFPGFSATVFRATAGLRFTAYSVSMAVEATYFGGATASASVYKDTKLEATLGGAAKLGWEWY